MYGCATVLPQKNIFQIVIILDLNNPQGNYIEVRQLKHVSARAAVTTRSLCISSAVAPNRPRKW